MNNTITIAPSTAQDIQKVFSDFGTDISLQTIVITLVAIKAAAGYVRNFALKNKVAEDSSSVSKFIAHLAGNSLPSQPVVSTTGTTVVPENTNK